MSKSTFPTILLAALLTGCAGDAMMSPSLNLLQSASNGSEVSRPFRGDCVLTGELTFTGPTSAILVAEGTCNLTHLGKSTIEVTEAVDFTTLAYSNVAIITAANGDEIHTTLSGLSAASAAGLTLTGAAAINGGTGRFGNASGSAVHTGVVTATGVTTATATYSFNGRVTY